MSLNAFFYVARIANRASELLDSNSYEPIGTYKCPDGQYHTFDLEETRRVIKLYASHLFKISKVLAVQGLAQWTSDEARREWFRWAEYVWNEELPFVIPRLRLYNREDPKRLAEIGKFITG